MVGVVVDVTVREATPYPDPPTGSPAPTARKDARPQPSQAQTAQYKCNEKAESRKPEDKQGRVIEPSAGA